MIYFLLVSVLGLPERNSTIGTVSDEFTCFDSDRRIVDLRNLNLTVNRTEKINEKFFSLIEEKLIISDGIGQITGTEIYNVATMAHANFEKRVQLFFGRIGKTNHYIYWNLKQDNGEYRAGLFKIEADSIKFYCSSDP